MDANVVQIYALNAKVLLGVIVLWLVVFLIYSFFRKKFELRNISRFSTIVFNPWFLVIIFTVLYSALSISRHMNIETHAYDLGIFAQMFYKYAHFEGLFVPLRGMNLLGDHFHPIFFFLTPLWYIWSDAKILLILQAFVISLGAVPAYLIAYKRFGHRFFAWSIAVLFLIFPGVQQAIAFDFHEIVFFPTILLFLAYFGFEKKWKWYWLFFILALMIKENTSVYVGAWSVFFMIREREYKRGFSGLAIAFVYFLLVSKVFMPFLSGIPEDQYTYYDFPQLGNTPFEALKTLVLHPIYSWEIFCSPGIKQFTQAIMASSGSFLFILAPLTWIITAPMLFEQFLFDVPSHWDFSFHYGVAISAPFIIATIEGMVSLLFLKKYIPLVRKIKKQHFLVIFGFYFLIFGYYITADNDYFLARLNDNGVFSQSESVQKTHEFLESVPEGVSVVTSHSLVPHLVDRSDILAWPPNRTEVSLLDLHAEYAVFHMSGSLWPMRNMQEQKGLIESFIKDLEYGFIASSDGNVIFKRGEQDSPDALDSWQNFLQEQDL